MSNYNPTECIYSAEDLYNMKLFEVRYYQKEIEIMRMPGGWLYIDSLFKQNIFIPFSDEFQILKNRS